MILYLPTLHFLRWFHTKSDFLDGIFSFNFFGVDFFYKDDLHCLLSLVHPVKLLYVQEVLTKISFQRQALSMIMLVQWEFIPMSSSK